MNLHYAHSVFFVADDQDFAETFSWLLQLEGYTTLRPATGSRLSTRSILA
jgi:hypothetical protein